MTIYQYPDYMYHYGVKGMKWGVRRAKKYIKRKTGYSDRHSSMIKRQKQREAAYYKQFYNKDSEVSRVAKDLADVGKKHFDNMLKQEALYKKNINSISVDDKTYGQVKKIVSNYEKEYQSGMARGREEYEKGRAKVIASYQKK